MVATFVAAAPIVQIPLASLEDPFYAEPTGLEHYKPGDILRSRKLDANLRSYYFPMYAKNVWQLMVRSLDSFDQPTTVVTTVIEPFNGNSSRILSYNFAEDSSLIECAVSYATQYDAPFTGNVVIESQMAFVSAALQQGWWINAPEFEGPKAAYSAGRQSGYASLFSVKGLLSSAQITDVDPNAEVVMSGTSSGSMAAGWAAALQPKYAPELNTNMKGAALGGFYTNIAAMIHAVDGTAYAGMISSSLTGLGNAYPEFAERLATVFAPSTWKLLNQAGKECLVYSSTFMSFSEVFTGSHRWVSTGHRIFRDKYVSKVLKDNTLGINRNEVPEMPIFIHHGQKDSVIPFKESNDTFNNWAAWGAPSVEFAASESTHHISESVLGAPAAFTWIKERFDGVPPIQGCKQTVRHVNLMYPGITDEALELVTSATSAIFGEEMGPFHKRSMVDLDTRGLSDFVSGLEGYFGSVFSGIFNWGGSSSGTSSQNCGGATTAAPPPATTAAPNPPKTTPPPPHTTTDCNGTPTPNAPPPTTTAPSSGGSSGGSSSGGSGVSAGGSWSAGLSSWLGNLFGGYFNGSGSAGASAGSSGASAGAQGGYSAGANVGGIGGSAQATGAASAGSGAGGAGGSAGGSVGGSVSYPGGSILGSAGSNSGVSVGSGGISVGGSGGAGVSVSCTPSIWNLWLC